MVILRNTNGVDATLGDTSAAWIDAFVVVACLSQRAIRIGPTSRNTLDALADFIAAAVIVTLTDFLANIIHT